MPRATTAALLGTCLLTLTTAAGAGVGHWTPVGPPGGRIGEVAIAPSQPRTILVTANGGLYRSLDGGQSWELAAYSDGVSALAIDPTNPLVVYGAWGGQAEVERSNDGGRVWEDLHTDLAVATKIVIDPRTPSTVYALGFGAGKSLDGGETWTSIHPELPGLNLSSYKDFEIDPQSSSRLYAVVRTDNPDSFRTLTSIDGGETWGPLGAPPAPARELVVDPRRAGTLIAAIGTGTLWRTTDHGAAWRRTNARQLPIAVTRLWLSPADPDTLFASDDQRLFRSGDGGGTFSEVQLPVHAPDPYRRIDLALHPTEPAVAYLSAGFGGLWKTVDTGRNFALLDLPATSVQDLAVHPSLPGFLLASSWASYDDTRHDGILVSREGGGTWDKRLRRSSSHGTVRGSVALGELAGPSLYAGVEDGVALSHDGGKTWEDHAFPCAADHLVVAPSDRNVIYAGVFSFAGEPCGQRTTDGGTTWEPIDAMPETVSAHDPLLVYTIHSVESDPPVHELRRSTDGGRTWQSANGDLGGPYLFTVAAHPNADGVLYVGTDAGVFRSTDAGTHWELAIPAPSHNPYATLLALDPGDPDTVYAYLQDSQGIEGGHDLYAATFDGSQWRTEVLPSPPGYLLEHLLVDPVHPRQLYARGGYGGLYSLTRAQSSACTADAATLCLDGGRFQVRAHWQDFQGHRGTGQASPLTDDTGTFWFFREDNRELVVKALNGSGVNGHSWIFYGAVSSVEYTVDVLDTTTGEARTYFNPPHTLASRADTEAFADTGAFAHVGATASRGMAWTGPGSDGSGMAGLGPVARRAMAGPAPGAAPRLSPPPCFPTATSLCLGPWQAYRVEIRFDANGQSGQAAHAVSLEGDSGYFWFFGPENVEVMVKVLDGSLVNGKVWVFYGALSNVGYTVTVTDKLSGAIKTYVNPAGTMASVADTEAFSF